MIEADLARAWPGNDPLDMRSLHLIECHPQSEAELHARLIDIVRQSAWFMAALSAVRDLGLDCWCIGAGAVRNLVWDTLHGFDTPSSLPDVDVAHFDTQDVTPQRDAAIAKVQAVLDERRKARASRICSGPGASLARVSTSCIQTTSWFIRSAAT